MRCPKCGYISFDHVTTCLKCNKDISGGVAVEGTTYHAAAPSFLRVPKKQDIEEAELQAEEFGDEDFEFADPDLDILSDEGDEISFAESDVDMVDIAIEEVEDEEEVEGIDFQLEADEDFDEDLDAGGFDFDFDEDEDEDEDEAVVSSVPEPGAKPLLSVPDELLDISDLAPPVKEPVKPDDSGSGMELSLDDEMNLDDSLDLDGLDLDLGFGAIDGEADEGFQSLSLDDIELSEADIGIDNSELDGLSMDLDLDGLDESSGTEKEKSSGSLEGLTLSLD
ncbi:MAG: hypothetical protein KKE53_13085 [Proteobacteria bacterium]|nr:hypothetical protein [Pseudomonadota bacterium]